MAAWVPSTGRAHLTERERISRRRPAVSPERFEVLCHPRVTNYRDLAFDVLQALARTRIISARSECTCTPTSDYAKCKGF
jgi:hypothetical protein